ncbi:MAG TPA: glycosyl transferase family protein, partial [Bryobacterales bacterium]|nr:glycosyl transferase family protein [Bryobacterales bacterium]
MLWLDRLAAGVLAPLAMWVLASGLDDLFLDYCSLWFAIAAWRRRTMPDRSGEDLLRAATLAEKKIALLIPAWREDAVIEQMLERNLAAIRYSNYEIFVGVYPNDLPTVGRVMAAERIGARVRHVACPHDGPTSKADCLNWIYRGVLAYEESTGTRFDIVMHHDAEDLIHPESLWWINRYAEHYDMVQVPVLPLETPLWELTHGTYIDEFAESHLKELHTRQKLGGFLPSCGVGTAYRRRALDRLAWNHGDQLFEPSSLTEDYQIGLELHRLGCSQILLDARKLGDGKTPGATREYFPRRAWSAVRQRGRWVAGIALQSWHEIGWNAGPGQLYWMWRDRKGLLGNPLTILANLIFLCGLAGWITARATRSAWAMGEMLARRPWLVWLLAINTALILVRLGSRAACVGSVYGWKHAAISPLRSVWGNVINFAACVRAVGLFAEARVRRRRVRWAKTEHSYPQPVAAQRRRLGEALVELRMLPLAQVEQALRSLGPGERLGERLVRHGALSEFMLYTALGIQQGIPFEPLEPHSVDRGAMDEAMGRL